MVSAVNLSEGPDQQAGSRRVDSVRRGVRHLTSVPRRTIILRNGTRTRDCPQAISPASAHDDRRLLGLRSVGSVVNHTGRCWAGAPRGNLCRHGIRRRSSLGNRHSSSTGSAACLPGGIRAAGRAAIRIYCVVRRDRRIGDSRRAQRARRSNGAGSRSRVAKGQTIQASRWFAPSIKLVLGTIALLAEGFPSSLFSISSSLSSNHGGVSDVGDIAKLDLKPHGTFTMPAGRGWPWTADELVALLDQWHSVSADSSRMPLPNSSPDRPVNRT
jgi:hypothetical protein